MKSHALMSNTILENLHNQYALIQTFEKKYGRKPGSVRLLAVSKGFAATKLMEAIGTEQRAFGENYLQEALKKISALSEYALEWHFIGGLQANKIKKIAQAFHWVQSVDSEWAAFLLNQARDSSCLGPLNICLQVNLQEEIQKKGLKTANVLELAAKIRQFPNLKLRGLMSIPAPEKDFAKQRQVFGQLRLLFEALKAKGFELDTLSMGMSEDFEAAIAEGATMVRLGRAIFGAR